MKEIVNLVQQLSAAMDDENDKVISVYIDILGSDVIVCPQWFVSEFNDFEVKKLRILESELKYKAFTTIDGVKFAAYMTEKEYAELIKTEFVMEGQA